MTVAEDMRLNYEAGLRLIPEHMRDGVTRYMERGVRPGGFLLSMLRGEGERALMSADRTNREALPEWLVFIADHLPIKAHGSPHLVEAWIAMGGLSGMPDQ